jgi:hypothetical protein
MSGHDEQGILSNEETEQRLQKVLQGAFSGPPTPLKRIPKRNGKSRLSEKRVPDALKKPEASDQAGS